MFIGFMAFVCLTKYNGGTNNLTVLKINDDDVNNGESGRIVARNKSKTVKDNTRNICAGGEDSSFAARGLSVEARAKVIKVAQFESQKIREYLKHKILQIRNKSDILLRERCQQIDMAKIICPVYDADAEVWM